METILKRVESAVKTANLEELRRQNEELIVECDRLKAELSAWPQKSLLHALDARDRERAKHVVDYDSPRLSACCRAAVHTKENMKYNGSETECVGTYEVCDKCKMACDTTR